ncbi:MAG: Phthiotriol/phenolphthiotriol dimycocerosates methyltransferase [Microgenomates group bacterium ADurb.Bin219]|nr:MAG: Phthiotriol/phenolphthiotriol dimycocerosates methyltransferase [Microgenomates group bacterium ADurb.Bin219]
MSHIYARQLDLVLEWLDRGRVKKVLDASCGKGRAIKRLHHTYYVTGVDISREMLEHVKDLELDRVDLVRADVDKLPFDSSVFDSVLCLEALVHYPNPRIALGEFRRVLRPHGLLIVDVDNENSLKRLVKKSGIH